MYVYFIQNSRLGHIKIGVANDVEKRLSSLQNANSVRLNVIKIVLCDSRKEAFLLEEKLHFLFKENRLMGEWFDISVSDVNSIPNLRGTKFLKKGEQKSLPRSWFGAIVQK